MFIFAVSLGGATVRSYLTFIPDSIFNFIEQKKWMILIFNFFIVGQISSFLNTTGAFEITANGSRIWSKLVDKKLPTQMELVNAIEDLGIVLN